MSEPQRAWTLDNSARASNPGGLRVNPFCWLRHYPAWPLVLFFGFWALVVLAWLVNREQLWGLAVAALAVNGFYWKRLREHFRYGDANPGIVVSLEPMLIAVATDLTKGAGQYPVVKIFNKRLPTIDGQRPRLGARLATVALYEGSSDKSPHWSDFDPLPAQCATGDQAALERIMNSFTQRDWDRLNSWLAHVPQPFRRGLYPIPPGE